MEHLAKLSHSITLRILSRIQSRQNVSMTRTPVLPFYKHPTPTFPSFPPFLSSSFLELIYHTVLISAAQQSDSATHLGASQVALVVKNLQPVQRLRRLGFHPWVGKIPWRRKWQPTPVFVPGKSHRQKSLAGYSPWGRKESDTT